MQKLFPAAFHSLIQPSPVLSGRSGLRVLSEAGVRRGLSVRPGFGEDIAGQGNHFRLAQQVYYIITVNEC